jgi:methionine aminopeptidase
MMSFGDDKIVHKSPEEIEKDEAQRTGGSPGFEPCKALVAPGATTMDLEKAAEKLIAELGATPAFKGYYGYPCVLCTSVNEEIVHGFRRKSGCSKPEHRFRRLRSGAGRLLRRRGDPRYPSATLTAELKKLLE